ncbi:MAG: LysR family transcriptional regulator [Ramlibacter sp.]|nr:LysR family transcriptional regulator [Ramlibacter sp.]
MTQAANRSHLTLAAVSARIRTLEASVGSPLLRRHARGVVPTPAGEALARHARLLVHQLDLARREVAPSRSSEIAQAIVLANSSAMSRPLARVLDQVLGAHAGLRVCLRESSSEVTVHALHAGAADVGLVTDAVNTDGLLTQRLGCDPLVLVASADHPLAGHEAIGFEEALPYDWVGWGEDSALHTHLIMQACEAGMPLKVRASIPSAQGVLELVASGWGVSVLPRALLHRLGYGEGLAVLPLAESWAQRQLLVCRSARARNAMAADVFNAFTQHWQAVEEGPTERPTR